MVRYSMKILSPAASQSDVISKNMMYLCNRNHGTIDIKLSKNSHVVHDDPDPS